MSQGPQTLNEDKNDENPDDLDATKVEGGLSLKELDAVISQEDPDFGAQILEIESDHAKSELNIELIDLDQVLEERKTKTWKARFSRLRHYIWAKLFLLWILGKNLALNLGQRSIDGLKHFNVQRKEFQRDFSKWPLSKKGLLLAILLVSAATVHFGYKAWTHGWLIEKQPLFLRSLREWSTKEISYESEHGLEPFFDSARVSQNLFSLKRVVVNIRRSDHSGPNPMAAFEFFLEGNSTEVIIEVKDRESEIRDEIQRTIEEMTYDQLVTTEGKQNLIEKLRRAINKLVTLGQIRKVYIKTFVIKP